MNRPEKRNAMNSDFFRELPQIIRAIDSHASARAIILSSTGPVFSAGLDMALMPNPDEFDKNQTHYALEYYQDLKAIQESISAIEEARIPVIAAINGGCYGAGVDLITACDMRFATIESFITIYEIMVAITADAGTFPRIMNVLPEGVVRELAYTGRNMHADECKTRGLLNECYDTETEMMIAVAQLARDIATRSPTAVYGCKRAINYCRDHTTADSLEMINIWNISMQQPTEIREAITAQREKRIPQFSDLPKENTK